MAKISVALLSCNGPERNGREYVVKIIVPETTVSPAMISEELVRNIFHLLFRSLETNNGAMVPDPITNLFVLAVFVHELSDCMRSLRDSLALGERRVHQDVHTFVHCSDSFFRRFDDSFCPG